MNNQRNQWAAADAAAGRTAAPNARGDEATDHVEQREQYAAEYGQLATQLANSDLAAQWYDMDVDAQTAASWANAGFLPSEAEQWHRGGVPVRVAADWADAGYLPREALPFTEKGIEAPARLTQQEAVEITTRHRDAGAEPHTRRYAQHLLDRYHTIRGIETMHGAGAENPDAVADVVEEMRRLSAHAPRPQEADRRALERAAATGSAQLRAQTALDRLDPGTRPFDLDPPSIDPAHSRGRGHAAAEVDDGHEDPARRLVGVQFHPEVAHTPYGTMRRCVRRSTPTWTSGSPPRVSQALTRCESAGCVPSRPSALRMRWSSRRGSVATTAYAVARPPPSGS
jgi:hypothetical protein